MRILEESFPINTAYPLEQLGAPEDLVFFDIETTGLSHRSSQLYLIGTTTLHCDEEGKWSFVLRQYFAETLSDEREILSAFFSDLTDRSILIDYNGHTFDIPYLEACAKSYHIASPLADLTEIDLLKDVRKLAKPLGLSDCKLRTVEEFLGIRRLDPYTGGELIEQYHAFQKSGEESLFSNLILHNRVDLIYLPPVLDLLLLFMLPEAPIEGLSAGLDPAFPETLLIQGKLCSSLPFPISLRLPGISWSCEDGETFALRVAGTRCSLTHFYPNYKDYYYLPVEGIAVHKRIAEFMNPEGRRKATREEAGISRAGLFFPQKKEAVTPAFRESSRSRESYFEYSPDISAEALSAYYADALSCLIQGRW